MKPLARPMAAMVTLCLFVLLGAQAAKRGSPDRIDPRPAVGNPQATRDSKEAEANTEGREGKEGEEGSEGETDRGKGPESIRRYFEQWHQQYGAVLPADVVRQTWEEIHRLPSEPHDEKAVNSWTPIGPYGMAVSGRPGTYYSGRVLDVDTSFYIKVATASGGLFSGLFGLSPISDQVNSLAIGSVAVRPNTNGQEILVGTGEPRISTGTGLWRTTDGGATWNQATMYPYSPSGFYKIRFAPGVNTLVHAATEEGIYVSSDGGATWIRRLTGSCTDVVARWDTFTFSVITSRWGIGLYSSFDDGDTWQQVNAPGLPMTDVGRVSLDASTNGNVIYASIARDSDNTMLGVYRSANAGATWQNVSPPADIFSSGDSHQGWYDNVIGCSPGNANICLAGGIKLWRTIDGGLSWAAIADADVHDDQHAIHWSDGSSVWEGNDGGLSNSADGGFTWTTSLNSLPITQFVNFDVGVSHPWVLCGGSQDNGFAVTHDGGGNWQFTWGGDGGGISIDPNDAARIWGTAGVYGLPWNFRCHRSTDFGLTWNNNINDGILWSQQWYTKIRNDLVAPVYLYTNSSLWIYRSTDFGDHWTALSPTLPAEVYNMSVSRYTGGSSVIYACLASPAPLNGRLLRVYDGGNWTERSSGLSTANWLRGVALHPTDTYTAYALTTGFAPGQKVYRTADRGNSWVNISGDLPNVPMGDLEAHPTNGNILYLGTEFGCFRTTDGGAHWHRWNNGMPEAVMVSEMGVIDRRSVDGTYFIVASTYGRGMWRREISGDDPPSSAESATLPADATLRFSPNPFRASTEVSFRLDRPGPVDLRVYDVSGREVGRILEGTRPAGEQKARFDASRLPAGVYWARLHSGDATISAKMVRLRD